MKFIVKVTNFEKECPRGITPKIVRIIHSFLCTLSVIATIYFLTLGILIVTTDNLLEFLLILSLI